MTNEAEAAEPSLCPVVGDGVNNTDSRNVENGMSTINPPVGTSVLSGKNKAGEKSNPNAHNSSCAGRNPDFCPSGLDSR